MSRFARAHSAFIAWLRQVRRSAWVLIGLCLLFRLGDAVVHDVPAGAPGVSAVMGS